MIAVTATLCPRTQPSGSGGSAAARRRYRWRGLLAHSVNGHTEPSVPLVSQRWGVTVGQTCQVITRVLLDRREFLARSIQLSAGMSTDCSVVATFRSGRSYTTVYDFHRNIATAARAGGGRPCWRGVTRLGTRLRALKVGLVAAVLAICMSGCPPSPSNHRGVKSATSGTTYFVDPGRGNDASPGTAATKPWKSLTRASDATLRPGDTLALAAGARWANDALEVTESGTAGAPITITRYGGASQDPEVRGLMAGYCFLVRGSYVVLEHVRAVSCGYPDSGPYGGIVVWGSHDVVRNAYVSGQAVGVFIKTGSNHGLYTRNVLANNNVENVNTAGSNCGTPRAVHCGDDSGSFGFLIQGDGNELSWNTVIGSAATSYDWGVDGGAFEIFNGNSNTVHHNIATDNNNFSELGHGQGYSATRNVFSYNAIRATCGRLCDEARGLIVRGEDSKYGPNTDTLFSNNTFYSNGARARGVTCHAHCSPAVLALQGNVIVATGEATGAWSVWSDAAFTETSDVLNGRYRGFSLNGNSSSAPARFVAAPRDLRITSTSPAVDRAGKRTFSEDLLGQPVPRDGNCRGGSYADAGAYEFQPTAC
jgi:hypothetical protein